MTTEALILIAIYSTVSENIINSHRYQHCSEIGNDLFSILKYIDFSRGPYIFYETNNLVYNILKTDNTIVYLVITTKNYPRRVALQFINEVNSTHITTTNSLITIGAKYSKPSNVDEITALNDKIGLVKSAMSENINTVLENGVKIDDLVTRSENLSLSASDFRTNATRLRNKLWWRNIRMKLMIAAIIIVILTILITVIVCTSGACK